MRLAIISNRNTGEVFAEQPGDITVFHFDSLPVDKQFDACIDLIYEPSPERDNHLLSLARIVIVNAVEISQSSLPPGFIRINGWPGFINSHVIEASTALEENKPVVESIFNSFGKKISWIEGFTGFIAPRVISMIINEAYFALEEKVSTRQEIDTAMKLGTNYPYGPFEWSARIGLSKIVSLLEQLARENKRYTPASLLSKEAKAS